MAKKLFKSALAGIMLVTILSASLTVNADPSSVTAAPRGTLKVYVWNSFNQTISNATVTAIRDGNGTAYNIPYQNGSQAYISILPVGVYLVTVQWGYSQSQNATIYKNQITSLIFFF